jgi:hypothetical protein
MGISEWRVGAVYRFAPSATLYRTELNYNF